MNRVPHRLLPLVLVGLSSAALSQEPATTARDRATTARNAPGRPERVDLPRDREWRHPGTPLQIQGIEQGENDFRESTPLLDGEFEPQLVDADENYRRQLAMYSEGASFTEPLRVGMGSSTHAPHRKHRPRSAAPLGSGEADSDGRGGGLAWILLVGLLVLVFVRSVRARRPQFG